MGPRHEGQSQLLDLELETQARAWILGAGQAKSPKCHAGRAGAPQILHPVISSGHREWPIRAHCQKEPSLFGQLPCRLHAARDRGLAPSEHIPPPVLVLRETHRGWGGGIKCQREADETRQSPKPLPSPALSPQPPDSRRLEAIRINTPNGGYPLPTNASPQHSLSVPVCLDPLGPSLPLAWAALGFHSDFPQEV